MDFDTSDVPEQKRVSGQYTPEERAMLMMYQAKMEAHVERMERLQLDGARLEAEFNAYVVGLRAKYGRAE